MTSYGTLSKAFSRSKKAACTDLYVYINLSVSKAHTSKTLRQNGRGWPKTRNCINLLNLDSCMWINHLFMGHSFFQSTFLLEIPLENEILATCWTWKLWCWKGSWIWFPKWTAKWSLEENALLLKLLKWLKNVEMGICVCKCINTDDIMFLG